MTAKNLAPIAASKVLELARVDGWFAVFDPSNPQYRELAEGRIASMSDVLGNLPEVRAEKPALQPDWVPTALNGMGAARHREQSVITLLTEVSFGEPMFIMMLAQFAAPGHHAAPGHPFDRQTIVDGQFGGDGRNIRGQGRLDQGALHIDTDGLMSAVNDTKPHVFECQVGPDGESLAQGFFVGGSPEVGHGNDDGHDSFSRLAPGDPHSPGHPHSERVREGHEGRSGRDVYVGPVLVFRGVPPEGVRERMSRLLTSFTSESRRVRVDQLVSRTAIRTDVHGEVEFEKNPDKLEVPASLTKMLTAYLTRQTIGDDQLNERVTLTSEDHLKGSEPGLRVGDELTYLDLLYLAMLPSHNVASEILASRVGPKLVGTGRGYGRFLAEMNATIRKWGWQGAVFTNASGLGMSNRATARQMSELLWRIANEDATLLKIMGARTYDINVAGPHARTHHKGGSHDPREGISAFSGVRRGQNRYAASLWRECRNACRRG